MKNQIAKIQTEITALTAYTDKVRATLASKTAERESIERGVNQAAAGLDAASRTLAAAVANEALAGGAAADTAAARAALAAAQKALTKVKTREPEIFEANAIADACAEILDKQSREIAGREAQLREVKIEALKLELKSRIEAFNAQIEPVGKIFAAVLGLDQLLTGLGHSQSIRTPHTNNFSLPGFRTEWPAADEIPMGKLVNEAENAVRREWAI